MRVRKEPVSIRRRGPGHEVEWYAQGRRRRRSFHLRSEAEAEKGRLEKLIREGVSPTRPTTREGIIQEWLEEIKATRRHSTWIDYRSRISRFAEWAGKRLLEMTADELGQYRVQREAMVSKATINGDLRCVSSFFSWCRRKRYMGINPVSEVSPYRTQQKLPGFLSKKEIDKLLHNTLEPEWKAVFALGIYAGLRASEIARLKWEHIDYSRRLIYVRGETKSYKERAIPLAKKLGKILEPLKQHGIVLGNRSKWALCHEANLRIREILGKGTLKDLRETFGSQLAMAGESIYKISVWMGHSSVNTTQKHYAHLAPEYEEGINAI